VLSGDDGKLAGESGTEEDGKTKRCVNLFAALHQGSICDMLKNHYLLSQSDNGVPIVMRS